MSSILDDPQVRQAVYPLSVEFYHQAGDLGLLGEDVELLEGTLVKRMPKSPLHEWLVERCCERLREHCSGACLVLKQRPLTCARSEPEPDVLVVRGEAGDFRQRHPQTAELIIEVAVSTLALDRQKAAIYAGARVKEYWIIMPEERRVEVYRTPAAGGYAERATFTSPGHVESLAVPGFGIDLDDLFQP